MTCHIACRGVIPNASAAWVWPRRMDVIPARKVSELKAHTLRESPSTPVLNAESWMSKVAGSTQKNQ
jgi:hypothetical protein